MQRKLDNKVSNDFFESPNECRISERPPFIQIKQILSEHYRKLLKENQNEEHWQMPKCKQDVKFMNSTSDNNEIVLNDDYKYSYTNDEMLQQRNC